MTQRLGRLVSPDDRDRRFQIRRQRSPLVRRYWRDSAAWLNQGDTPSCVGHAWSHWALNAPIIQSIDPMGVYRLAQCVDEWPGEEYDGTSVRAGAKVMELLGFISEYRWAWTLPPMIDALLTQGPVVLGINWYAGMDEPDRDGFLHPTGELVGGHAILATGIDVERKKIRLKNSWGQEWGENGRAWLSFDDARRLISEDGEVCLAIEKEAM